MSDEGNVKKIHSVLLDHDQKKEWDRMVTGLSFDDAMIIRDLVKITMKLGDSELSPDLIKEASSLSKRFLESELSHVLFMTFAARMTLVDACAISPEAGHG